MLTSWIKRRRSREERARKVVQGIRLGLKAGHLPARRKPKAWKKHPITFSEYEAPEAWRCSPREAAL